MYMSFFFTCLLCCNENNVCKETFLITFTTLLIVIGSLTKIQHFWSLSTLRSLLKYGFYKKSLRKDATLTSWTLLAHFFPDNFFKKSLLNDQVHFRKKNNRTVSFQGCHSQFMVPIKQPGLDIWKKSLLNDQYYFFSNFRSLERQGLIIESLE